MLRLPSVRNTVTQLLAPKVSIRVIVDPPVTDDEQPYLFTVRGVDTIVMKLNDDGSEVLLSNPTDNISPMLFFVAPKPATLRTRLMASIFKLLNPKPKGTTADP